MASGSDRPQKTSPVPGPAIVELSLCLAAVGILAVGCSATTVSAPARSQPTSPTTSPLTTSSPLRLVWSLADGDTHLTHGTFHTARSSVAPDRIQSG